MGYGNKISHWFFLHLKIYLFAGRSASGKAGHARANSRDGRSGCSDGERGHG